MKTYKLLDKKTDVPADLLAYKNKVKFNPIILNLIDTNVIFESYNKKFKVLERLDNNKDNAYYGAFKFYSNGCFNKFFLNKEKEPLQLFELNPLYNGYRGVYYIERNITRYDIFVPVDQRYNLGKKSGSIHTNGDTLFIKLAFMQGAGKIKSDEEIYIKRRLPSSFFVFKANW